MDASVVPVLAGLVKIPLEVEVKNLFQIFIQTSSFWQLMAPLPMEKESSDLASMKNIEMSFKTI